MSTLLRIDASIRAEGSVTRSIADRLQSKLTDQDPSLSIIHRDLGLAPLPHTAWAGAVFGPYTPADQQTAEQREGIALVKKLADELVAADAAIFALPLYNFSISQHFKAWVDILLTDPRFAPGTQSPVKGRPAQLVVAKGGGYTEGTPRHGWDHATGWYERILRDVLLFDLDVIECELTLADSTPAMEGLRDLAASNLADAHAAADRRAGDLAIQLRGQQAA